MAPPAPSERSPGGRDHRRLAALVLVHLLPVVGWASFGWTLLELVVVYWFEAVFAVTGLLVRQLLHDAGDGGAALLSVRTRLAPRPIRVTHVSLLVVLGAAPLFALALAGYLALLTLGVFAVDPSTLRGTVRAVAPVAVSMGLVQVADVVRYVRSGRFHGEWRGGQWRTVIRHLVALHCLVLVLVATVTATDLPVAVGVVSFVALRIVVELRASSDPLAATDARGGTDGDVAQDDTDRDDGSDGGDPGADEESSDTGSDEDDHEWIAPGQAAIGLLAASNALALAGVLALDWTPATVWVVYVVELAVSIFAWGSRSALVALADLEASASEDADGPAGAVAGESAGGAGGSPSLGDRVDAVREPFRKAVGLSLFFSLPAAMALGALASLGADTGIGGRPALAALAIAAGCSLAAGAVSTERVRRRTDEHVRAFPHPLAALVVLVPSVGLLLAVPLGLPLAVAVGYKAVHQLNAWVWVQRDADAMSTTSSDAPAGGATPAE